jgi:hypothetical protein
VGLVIPAAGGWPGFWGLEGPEYLGWLGQRPERDQVILMGANTSGLMSEFVHQSGTSESDLRSEEEASVNELNNASKVVLSSTLQPPLSWRDIQPISGDAVEAVRAMKREGNRPMSTLGSLAPCWSLIQAGLVERFRVVVFPVITGGTGYDRIYDGYPDVALDLVASQTFDGRLQLLDYIPRVLAGPPGTQSGS